MSPDYVQPCPKVSEPTVGRAELRTALGPTAASLLSATEARTWLQGGGHRGGDTETTSGQGRICVPVFFASWKGSRIHKDVACSLEIGGSFPSAFLFILMVEVCAPKNIFPE